MRSGKEAVRPATARRVFGFEIKVGTNTKPLLDILEDAQVEVRWLTNDKAIEVNLDSPLGRVGRFPGNEKQLFSLAQPYGTLSPQNHYWKDNAIRIARPAGHPDYRLTT